MRRFYWCGQLSVLNVKYDLLSDVNVDLTALCDCTVALKDLNNVLDSVGTLSYKEELSSKYKTQIECLDECYSLSVKRDSLMVNFMTCGYVLVCYCLVRQTRIK